MTRLSSCEDLFFGSPAEYPSTVYGNSRPCFGCRFGRMLCVAHIPQVAPELWQPQVHRRGQRGVQRTARAQWQGTHLVIARSRRFNASRPRVVLRSEVPCRSVLTSLITVVAHACTASAPACAPAQVVRSCPHVVVRAASP